MTRVLIAVFAATAIILAGVAYIVTVARSGGDFAACRNSSVTGAGDIGGDFTLVDETGKTVTSDEVLDQPALVYFGYTFCPDICPVDVARNAEAVDILDARDETVKPIFISIDPARDTPEVLAAFTDAMHPRMLGLTGSPEQVRAASQAYRTFYKAQEAAPGEEGYYLVDHSTLTYLMMPDHGFVQFFRRDINGAQMADKVQCFLDAA